MQVSCRTLTYALVVGTNFDEGDHVQRKLNKREKYAVLVTFVGETLTARIYITGVSVQL